MWLVIRKPDTFDKVRYYYNYKIRDRKPDRDAIHYGRRKEQQSKSIPYNADDLYDAIRGMIEFIFEESEDLGII